ncbi:MULTISPECIES: maleylpyruvate isomerase family mycothiol-dependent enzyme [Streptomyces]|uniref:maleylpyruvate isomerase family mycothiol-dependent enzyme n=1 Tax=Streptomyces TaxID=1883 RepID=UPI0002F52083|nr:MULTISPECIES: maleylpyruvate isomerase family mycothiol-dependent enzyme [Streptomyces]
MTQPHIDQLASGLLAQIAAFADAVDGADWDAPVPTCPEWPLRVLVGHLGQAPRWAAGIVRGGSPDGIPDPREAVPPQNWRAWLLAGASELVEAVRAIGPGTPVWTLTGPGPASFWLRQAAHDTSVHAVDAALLAGVPYALEPDLAADAVTQCLELLSSPVAEALKPAVAALRGAGSIGLRPSEGAIEGWVITRTQTGVSWRRGPGRADVTVTGAVEDLLLVLMRRLPPQHVAIDGDGQLFDHWLAHSAL